MTDGKSVYLFQSLGGGNVRYVAEATYLGHHLEERRDSDGHLRQAIVFELGLESETSDQRQAAREPRTSYSGRNFRRASLEELRQLAQAGAGRNASANERRRNVHLRSEAVRAYVLKRAAGVCEGCGDPAPFVTKRKQPYLEAHHTTRVADGGPDHPAHVIALCPTCHRRVHQAHDGDDHNRTLIQKLTRIEGAP